MGWRRANAGRFAFLRRHFREPQELCLDAIADGKSTELVHARRQRLILVTNCRSNAGVTESAGCCNSFRKIVARHRGHLTLCCGLDSGGAGGAVDWAYFAKHIAGAESCRPGFSCGLKDRNDPRPGRRPGLAPLALRALPHETNDRLRRRNNRKPRRAECEPGLFFVDVAMRPRLGQTACVSLAVGPTVARVDQPISLVTRPR